MTEDNNILDDRQAKGSDQITSISFANDIVPMFTEKDINCMSPYDVLLDDYAYMANPDGNDKYPDHANAWRVYARLTGDETPQMPKGEKLWTAADNPEGQKKLQTLHEWMTVEPAYQP